MSLWQIAWAYLWNRKFTTALTILSVGLAVGLITSVLTLRREAQQRFEEEGQAFDLVVGASGSPLQLVLSSVYLMDQPVGNIPLSVYETIRQDSEYVTAAFPIGLGDSYQGFRIVGTTPQLFGHKWVSPISREERSPFNIIDGSAFQRPFEAVIGARVAETAGLRLGDSFVGTHGFTHVPEGMQEHDHSNTPYTVVGIMAPSGSPFDRGIFVDLESVWISHDEPGGGDGDEADHAHDHDGEHDHDHEHDGEHEHDHVHEHDETATAVHDHDHTHVNEEITAVLVQLQSFAYRFEYLEKLRDMNVNAAVPINEVAKLFDQFLGTAKTVLLAVGYLVVVISALSILIGLYMSILQRKRDLAIMRSLGASSGEIFGAVLIEAFLVTVLGIMTGWIIGQFVSWGLGLYLAQRYGLTIAAFGISSEELSAYATVALIGLLAGILPAWQAYHSDIARDLADR